MNLLQLTSSDWSEQSISPSHLQLLWMQFPFAHSKSWSPHDDGVFSGCFFLQFFGHSSDPSVQSTSPSQSHWAGTHIKLLHWKDWGLQVGSGQDISSEPSEQSFSLSQTNILDMHWPLAHWNWLAKHCFTAAVKKNGGKGINLMMKVEK